MTKLKGSFRISILNPLLNARSMPLSTGKGLSPHIRVARAKCYWRGGTVVSRAMFWTRLTGWDWSVPSGSSILSGNTTASKSSAID